MKKVTKSSENNISLKNVIDWIVALSVVIIPSISTNLFDSKDNVILKIFFVSLITSLLATFIWIKLFSDKKIVNRLIKEIETKKDLENEIRKAKYSLEWSRTFLSQAEKDKEQLSQEKNKLQNERDQLSFALTWCGISQKELCIDKNISFFEWEKNPEIKKKIEEITNKSHKEKRELEEEILNLRVQLKNNSILWYNHHISDKRLRKEVINEVESY